jgi:MFS transporter, DHA1 family, tetracycline resistance protein
MMVGFSLMLGGTMSGLVQAVLVKRLVPKLGETRAVITGFTISIIANLCYGFAPQGWMILCVIGLAAFAGISGPALQSYISKHVPPDQQGAVQGVLGGLQSLASIPGSAIATWSLGWAVASDPTIHLPWFFSFLDRSVTWLVTTFLPRHPGIAFFEAAAFICLSLFLAQRSFRRDAAAAAS